MQQTKITEKGFISIILANCYLHIKLKENAWKYPYFLAKCLTNVWWKLILDCISYIRETYSFKVSATLWIIHYLHAGVCSGHHVSCWQAKLPVKNKKNHLDSWASVQVGEPKITWSLLITSHLKMGRPPMWYWCIAFPWLLLFFPLKMLTLIFTNKSVISNLSCTEAASCWIWAMSGDLFWHPWINELRV